MSDSCARGLTAAPSPVMSTQSPLQAAQQARGGHTGGHFSTSYIRPSSSRLEKAIVTLEQVLALLSVHIVRQKVVGLCVLKKMLL